jgi:hypothetical protein
MALASYGARLRSNERKERPVKSALRLLKIALFTGALAVLVALRPSQPRAQFMGYTCATFVTEPIDCPSCCPDHPILPNQIDGYTGPGYYSSMLYNYSCGTRPANCQYDCSGSYYEEINTFDECCEPAGYGCTSDVPCCTGLDCVSGTCCAPTHGSCTTDSDCCSDACQSGECLPSTC